MHRTTGGLLLRAGRFANRQRRAVGSVQGTTCRRAADSTARTASPGVSTLSGRGAGQTPRDRIRRPLRRPFQGGRQATATDTGSMRSSGAHAAARRPAPDGRGRPPWRRSSINTSARTAPSAASAVPSASPIPGVRVEPRDVAHACRSRRQRTRRLIMQMVDAPLTRQAGEDGASRAFRSRRAWPGRRATPPLALLLVWAWPLRQGPALRPTSTSRSNRGRRPPASPLERRPRPGPGPGPRAGSPAGRATATRRACGPGPGGP